MQNLMSTHENEWARPYLISVLKEVTESNGKIKEVSNKGGLIQVLSNISNFLRYDIISKNEIVTYSIPKNLNNDIGCLFSS